MAYKTFVNGFPLNASEINNNLMNQVISTFADAATRSTQLDSPVEGQVTYLNDTNLYYKWTGSEWVELKGFTDEIPQADVAGLTSGTEGFTAISDGSNGLVYQPVSHNYIINGAFDVWQRGTSIPLNSGADGYFADRHFVLNTGSGDLTLAQSTEAPEGFIYSAKIQRNAGSTDTGSIRPGQVLTNDDSLGLAGKQVTLSFWAKAGANWSGTAIQVYTRTGTGTDVNMISNASGTDTSDPVNVTPTTSWQRFTATYDIPSNAKQVSYLLIWSGSGTAGADDSIYITGVQLEAGSVATPFKRHAPDVGLEELACKRFFERLAIVQGLTGTYRFATTVRTHLKYLPKRATPTISLPSGSLVTNFGPAGAITATSFDARIESAQINLTMDTSQTVGYSTQINISDGVDIAAEL